MWIIFLLTSLPISAGWAGDPHTLRDPVGDVLQQMAADKPEPATTVPRVKTKPSAKSYAAPIYSHQRIIVIDPGHGGMDPGATGRDGAHEKDITLAVGRALRDALKVTGHYRVVMTRDSDVYLKLGERVKVGQSAKADLFISLHADTVGTDSAADTTHGASIYTISDQASDQVSARLAARENKADLIGPRATGKDAVVGNILLDLLNQETMTRSKSLADEILDALDNAQIQMLERTHRSAGFAVLKGAEFPSALIEMGFLSSEVDETHLKDTAYQKHLAAAIASGVDGFFVHDKLVNR